MEKPAVIEVDGVSKAFKLPHEKQSSVKSLFVNMFRRRRYERQQVLKNISFDVKEGEFFGIVGRNGSGKSTLLKLLAGIYATDKGDISVKGSLTPFIELGVGFNPELTGRENVYLNGALLGFNRKEMDAMYDDIVSFAELRKFMDQKLKNYSSGMQVRLAFSIAIRAKSDILLIDEVLAVGDAAFQKKCFDIFRELKKQGRTIILVTHDMDNVERFCDRALVIHNGKKIALAKPHEASSLYARLNVEADDVDEESTSKKKPSIKRWGSGHIRAERITTTHAGKKTKVISSGEEFSVSMKLERRKGYEKTPVICGLAIFNSDGVKIAGPNSLKAQLKPGIKELTCTIPAFHFAPGEYKMTIVLFDENLSEQFDVLDQAVTISVISGHTFNGLVELESDWKA